MQSQPIQRESLAKVLFLTPHHLKRLMHPKSLANLKRKLEQNEPGVSDKDSQVVSVRLHLDVVAAIAELEGDRSYHIRQAVLNYLKTRDRASK